MLKTLFRISLRNVLRRKLQTTLLGFMISFTTFAIFAMLGMQTGAYKMIENSYTTIFNGDIQIRNSKYNIEEDDESFKYQINNADLKKVFNILKTEKNVDFSERYIHFGLADANNKNYSFQLIGADPITEQKVSIVARRLQSGSFLDKNSYNDIVIGLDLAEFLGIKVGDDIVMMTTDIYDSFVIDSFKVKGIYKTGEPGLDKGSAFINKSYFDDNIIYEPNKATNITVKMKDASTRANLIAKLKQVAPKGVTILSWDKVLPEIKQMITFDIITSMFFYGILVILVGFTIVNSMMLATVKRMPEFGILNAVGLDNQYFKWILFFENIILGTLFVLIGCICGMIFVIYFSHVGIYMPDLGGEQAADQPLAIIDRILYPNPKDPLLLVGPIMIYISCLISIIPPVMRLSKSNPIQAITSE